MRYLIVILTASLLLPAFGTAEAQILKRLKKKAQEAAAQKAEEKLAEQVQHAAEQMVEQSWSSIFGEMEPDSTGRLPFLQNSNVVTEDEYHFDTITTMEIQTTAEDGQSDPPTIMDMHFNTDEMYTGTSFSNEEMKEEEGELFIIYDFKNSAMLMLMANDKNKFSFAYDWNHAMDMVDDSARVEAETELEQEELRDWQGYTKIGSKEILGYSCDGYKSQTDNEDLQIWVTRDAEYGMNQLFRAQTNTKQIKGTVPENYPAGMIMEMMARDLDSGETTTMRVTDIQKNARVRYVMADYPAMSFAPQKPKN